MLTKDAYFTVPPISRLRRLSDSDLKARLHCHTAALQIMLVQSQYRVHVLTGCGAANHWEEGDGRDSIH